MRRFRDVLIAVALSVSTQLCHGFVLQLSSTDFVTTTIFSDVRNFDIRIDIAAPLQPGVFDNPPLNGVVYNVVGDLEPGTPSEFPAFDLQRSIGGSEFYTQGSSLRFEIAAGANLDDGLQADELRVLGDSGDVFIFDGREIDNGRFHPAILRLSANGTGSIRNSNNVPTLEPRVDVASGSEYITDLTFDAGNLRLDLRSSGGGGGAPGKVDILLLLMLLQLRLKARRRFKTRRD